MKISISYITSQKESCWQVLSDAWLSCIKKYRVSRAKLSQRQRILFARFAKAKWGNMELQKGCRERNFGKRGQRKLWNKRSAMGATLITLSGVLVLHDCMIVVFQSNLSKKPLVIGLSTLSEHINVPHRHSKGKQPKFCRVFFEKRL